MEIDADKDTGLASIRAVSRQYPQMLIGARTILTVDDCMDAINAGAKYIATPGYCQIIANWCTKNDVLMIPGCATQTEIMSALSTGLKTLKIISTNDNGGINACENFSSTFKSQNLKLIPAEVASNENLREYADKAYIHAVSGGWLCNPDDVKNHDFAAITTTVQEAIKILLGFEVAHIGINQQDTNTAATVGNNFSNAFGFTVKEGPTSFFASSAIEIMKSKYIGSMGHVAIRTNSIPRAIHYLDQRGYQIDWDTAKYKSDHLSAIYLKDEFGGFAVHLLQK